MTSSILARSPAVGALPSMTRAASTSPTKKRKIVVVGAGFLGSYIAKALVADSQNQIVLASRNPSKLHDSLKHLGSQLLPPLKIDITQPNPSSSSPYTPLKEAFKDADAVVSLVGILTGTEKQFVDLQQKGGENVALAAKEALGGEKGKRVVMISALGIDTGETPYSRTKLAAEKSFLQHVPSSTIIRPSLIFGPGDSFFARFATLAQYLPFLPLFGGGKSLFQPVYAGDVAKAVKICLRDDEAVEQLVGGKVVEAGGPDVFTYRQLMELVLTYTSLRRILLPLPFWFGHIQAFFLEKLPVPDVLKLTRDQVKQLKRDNKESSPSTPGRITIADLISKFPSTSSSSSAAPTLLGRDGKVEPREVLKSVYDILPLYIGPQGKAESGKRRHGRDHVAFDDMKAEVEKMTRKAEEERKKK